MTQNPYAQPIGEPTPPTPPGMPADRRTSGLAILSLVFALICFLPFTGAIALMLGGIALLAISRSRGRLGGSGLAIAGIVLGLIVSALQIAIFIGMSGFGQLVNSSVLVPVNSAMRAVDMGDHASARAILTPEASKQVTDAQLDAFAKHVQSKLGAYRGTFNGLWDTVFSSGPIRPLAVQFQGQDTNAPNMLIPVPVKFDKDLALCILDVRRLPGGGVPTDANAALLASNIGIYTIAGDKIWLLDPKEAAKLPASSKTNAPPPPTTMQEKPRQVLPPPSAPPKSPTPAAPPAQPPK